MKNLILILFFFLISCNQSESKNITYDFKQKKITEIDSCKIPIEVLNYINQHDNFEFIKQNDLKLLDEYLPNTDVFCSLAVNGDFNNDGHEDFAIILRYKDYKSKGYGNYIFPFLIIFDDFKNEINPHVIYKTGDYENEDIKSVIYDQFDKGIFSYLEKDKLCNKDIINIIIPEKSVFHIIWNDARKTYDYSNSLDEFSCDNKPKSINNVMQDNITTPEMVIDYLVFTKDNKGNLQINTEILEYISKNTTKENSSYLFALESYGQKSRSSLGWSIDEFAEIRGYIFNTSYPLRKKYWSDKYEEWYNGKPEKIFGDSDSWRDNNYYGLPHLKEYVEDFIVTYW